MTKDITYCDIRVSLEKVRNKMAKVIMRYEATYNKYLEIEVPDKVYNDVMTAKKELKDFVHNCSPDMNWWNSVEYNRYDHACKNLEQYIDFNAPYTTTPDADYIYINSLEMDGDEE